MNRTPRRVIVVYEETRPGRPDRVICTSADPVVVEAVEAALGGLLARNPTPQNKWGLVEKLLRELFNSDGTHEPHEWYAAAAPLLKEMERD